MLEALKLPELRKKILFTFFILIIFRFLAHVPVPVVNLEAVQRLLASNPLLGLFNIFSGGGFQNFSIVTLGLNPYINATIIIQLFTVLVPSLEALSKEGEAGREKLNMYSRFLTLPIALLQSYGIYFLLNRQGVIPNLDLWRLVILIFTLTAGTMLLMWLGELVTEYGVGQGISLLIFAGIIGSLPQTLAQGASTLNESNFLSTGILVLLTIAIIFGVVLANEGMRNVPLEYGRTGMAGARPERVTNYLPIKINQAGVIPIIFAVSVVLIPSLISGPLLATVNPVAQAIGTFLARNFAATSPLYNLTYFMLVIGFTYFYTSIQFNPEKIADDLKKRGGFIPGIRPGKNTTDFLGGVIMKITLIGALFLGIIAIMPFLIQSIVGTTNFAIGGTSLLIVVSVILETLRQIESMVVTKNYHTFLN